MAKLPYPSAPELGWYSDDPVEGTPDSAVGTAEPQNDYGQPSTAEAATKTAITAAPAATTAAAEPPAAGPAAATAAADTGTGTAVTKEQIIDDVPKSGRLICTAAAAEAIGKNRGNARRCYCNRANN